MLKYMWPWCDLRDLRTSNKLLVERVSQLEKIADFRQTLIINYESTIDRHVASFIELGKEVEILRKVNDQLRDQLKRKEARIARLKKAAGK